MNMSCWMTDQHNIRKSALARVMSHGEHLRAPLGACDFRIDVQIPVDLSILSILRLKPFVGLFEMAAIELRLMLGP